MIRHWNPDPAPDPEQLALDLGELVVPDHVAGSTIQDRFEAFHQANQWVAGAYERLTQDWLNRGHQRIGIGMLTEVIRWQYGRRTVAADGFRLNNNFRSRYVRLLIERHPEWADVFETRALKTP